MGILGPVAGSLGEVFGLFDWEISSLFCRFPCVVIYCLSVKGRPESALECTVRDDNALLSFVLSLS